MCSPNPFGHCRTSRCKRHPTRVSAPYTMSTRVGEVSTMGPTARSRSSNAIGRVVVGIHPNRGSVRYFGTRAATVFTIGMCRRSRDHLDVSVRPVRSLARRPVVRAGSARVRPVPASRCAIVRAARLADGRPAQQPSLRLRRGWLNGNAVTVASTATVKS